MVGHRQKNIPPNKGKQTSTCFEIHFHEFRGSAVEVSHLNMALNEFNSLRKTFNVKSYDFFSVRSLLHVVKTDKKSRCVEKREVSNYYT